MITVGDLRKAIEGMPDDLPVEAWMVRGGEYLDDAASVCVSGVRTTGMPSLVVEIEAYSAAQDAHGPDTRCIACGLEQPLIRFEVNDPGDLVHYRCPTCRSEQIEVDDFIYGDADECVEAGDHLKLVDDDGYCQFCGEQDGGDADTPADT